MVSVLAVRNGVPPPSGPPVPSVVQMIASSTNVPAYTGGTNNNYLYVMPNSVQSGNALAVSATWPNGKTVTISDNVNGTWPAAIVTQAGGQLTSGWFLLTSAGAGITKIKATLDTNISVQPFQWNLFELVNVVGSNGSSSGNQTGPNLSCGSFTPGNNDANGGNLILSYFCNAFGDASSQPSIWTPGSGHTLLEADLCGLTSSNNYFPHAAQYFLQTAHGAINPSATATGDTVDQFNSVAIALKAGRTGSPAPAGIYIKKILHQTFVGFSGNSVTLQAPFEGNLRVIHNRMASGQSVTDSSGNTYTVPSTGIGHGGIYAYAQNVTPDTGATITMAQTGGFVGQITSRIYDIQGAKTSSYNSDITAYPFTDYSGTSPAINDAPDFTPGASSGVTIVVVWPEGMGQSVVSPSGAIFDTISYDGSTHADGYESSDLMGHLYFNSNSQQVWDWTTTVAGGGQTAWGYAASFS